MLIDCHTHAFADKIADKAVTQLIEYYKISTSFGGRLFDLITAANEANLDALIMLVAATKPEQLIPANNWALNLAQLSPAQLQTQLGIKRIPKLIPFGTFHPDSPDWEGEIARLKAAGIKGIKLHPEFQQIDLADPKLHPFWETVKDDFILMIHVGDPVITPNNLSTPKKIAQIIHDFPEIQIIAAHLGGYCFWEEALTELAGKKVYLDTSSALSYISPELFHKIFNKHGSNRILFGSDYPLESPAQALKSFDQFPWLKGTDREKILGKNCAELLGL